MKLLRKHTADREGSVARSTVQSVRASAPYWRAIFEQIGRVVCLAFGPKGLIQLSRQDKRLRVRESVSLGDKRFVAIVSVDQQQFLLGGSSSSISLLAHLEVESTSFAQALNKCTAEQNVI